MKVLIVNKFLKPVGGSETYVFTIAKSLTELGHEVQFFGMHDKSNTKSNQAGVYTEQFDFHNKSVKWILYPFSIIYSLDSRRKIRRVLEDFQPDVVHLNLFNFHITPSIIYEIVNYERTYGHSIKIIYTAHEYQLVCPNYKLISPNSNGLCEKCLNGSIYNCVINRCVHNSLLKSIIAMIEGYMYRALKTYRYIDKIICPTTFMADKLKKNQLLKDKLIVRYNPAPDIKKIESDNKAELKYILYFGRYSDEKGIVTLLEACDALPDIEFVFAGRGPLKDLIKEKKNVLDLGFLHGKELHLLISGARATVLPSECFENGSLSNLESQLLGIPVISANIGGIPERVANNKTALLFKSGDAMDLCDKIRRIWEDDNLHEALSENCRRLEEFVDYEKAEEYSKWLESIYLEG